jgi:hypothetical protein
VLTKRVVVMPIDLVAGEDSSTPEEWHSENIEHLEI